LKVGGAREVSHICSEKVRELFKYQRKRIDCKLKNFLQDRDLCAISIDVKNVFIIFIKKTRFLRFFIFGTFFFSGIF